MPGCRAMDTTLPGLVSVADSSTCAAAHNGSKRIGVGVGLALDENLSGGVPVAGGQGVSKRSRINGVLEGLYAKMREQDIDQNADQDRDNISCYT